MLSYEKQQKQLTFNWKEYLSNYLGNCNAPPNRRLSDRLYSAGPEATPELGNDTTRVR